MILRLAARNLLRKSQRTAITTAALGLAGALMLYFSCLSEGFQATLVANLIDLETAHLQAHAREWRRDPNLYALIPDPRDAMEAMERGGGRASPRLYAWGLAALGAQSAAVELRGIDPAREREVTRMHAKMAQGLFLEPGGAEGGAEGAVLGQALARKLGAKIGSELVVLVQAADGSLSDRLFTVQGILGPVSAKTDGAGLFIREAAFREMLALPEGCHEIALRLPGRPGKEEAARAAAELQARRPELEVLDWPRLKPMAAQVLDAQRIGVLILMTIAYGAVGLVVFNAMLMNVFERLPEFGVMKALGAPPSFVLRLIYAEALLESLAAAAVSLALALPLALRAQARGLDLSGLSTGAHVAGLILEPVIYAKVSWTALWPPLLFLFAVAFLAVAYPAGKAALLRPVAAIHHR